MIKKLKNQQINTKILNQKEKEKPSFIQLESDSSIKTNSKNKK